MLANDAFHIAVLPGDGIGPEVMAPALEVLKKIEATTPGLKFRFTEGAGRAPTTTRKPASRCRIPPSSSARRPTPSCSAPAACRRCAIPTTPRSCRRSSCASSSTSTPACGRAGSSPACPPRSSAPTEHGIDLVVIRESTEGLFASMGKGVVTHDEGRETLVITRKTSERLFDFSFRYAQRRKSRGPNKGKLTCVDKANAFKAYAFFRTHVRRMRRRSIRACRPTGSTSTPAPPCWCAGRGTSTSW